MFTLKNTDEVNIWHQIAVQYKFQYFQMSNWIHRDHWKLTVCVVFTGGTRGYFCASIHPLGHFAKCIVFVCKDNNANTLHPIQHTVKIITQLLACTLALLHDRFAKGFICWANNANTERKCYQSWKILLLSTILRYM